MFCSYCGAKLEDGANFCKKCGKRVSEYENVFEKKKAVEQVPAFHGTPANDDQELRLFVGKKKESYYLEKWSKGDRSWNWAAFFLSFYWLGYRKMFKPILVATGLFLLLDFGVALFDFDDTKLNGAIGISVGMTFGFWGNYFYRKHAAKKILEIKNRHHDDASITHEVKLRGGTSWLGVLGSVGITIGYAAVSMLISMFVPAINQPAESVNAVGTSPHTQNVNSNASIKAEVQELLQKNIGALENEDLDNYLATIYEGTGIYDQTRGMLEQLFANYDLDYDVSNIEFLSVSTQGVKVRVTQTTTLVEGDDFRDNESIIVHTLKRQNGKWKFFNSVADSVHYLDDEGMAAQDISPSVGDGDTSAADDIIQQTCISCHGNTLEGGPAGPSLINIGSKYSQDELEEIILNGQGVMPGGFVSEEDARLLAEWLSK